MPLYEEYCREIASIWDNHYLTNVGPKHQALQAQLKEFWKAEYVELFVNGHLSLEIAIKALELSGEVITTPYTFASSTHALVANGLTPVFCDIKASDFTIDEDKIEALITEKTSAILAVHVYGQPCNVKRLEEIAKKHHLKLIFDAAHAFGVEVDGRPVSDFGDVSMFSFHATKVFHTIEGGALVIRDEEVAKKVRALRNFGIEGPESVPMVGTNAKMNEFAAAMGICNLRHHEENMRKRSDAFAGYSEGLEGIPGIRKFEYVSTDFSRNYAYYPIIVDEKACGISRDTLQAELEKQNIYTRKYFYPLTSDFACYQGMGLTADVPVAHNTSDRVLCLPMYAELGRETVDEICGAIREIMRG